MADEEADLDPKERTMTSDDLDARLSALEARAPSPGRPPAMSASHGRRPSRRLSPLLAAGALTLAVGATAVAGGVLLRNEARGHEGIQNPGQPLHGASMECMSPPEAERFLAHKGYRDVVWQVESGTPRGGRTVSQSKAPQHGFVIPGAVLDDGKLHMVVEQREDATAVGDCYGMKMP